MSIDSREAKERRREARASWPVARARLGEEPSDDLSEVTTPAERIAMMWVLAESAWTVARRPWPTYDRRNMPARLFRPGTRPPDDDGA
jgi:hypothetical protein